MKIDEERLIWMAVEKRMNRSNDTKSFSYFFHYPIRSFDFHFSFSFKQFSVHRDFDDFFLSGWISGSLKMYWTIQ